MKKHIAFCCAAFVSAACAISCSKETADVKAEEKSKSGKLLYSVNVSLEGGTRATLGEPEDNIRKTSWNTGDRISVNGHVSDALDAEYEGNTFASFSFEEDPYSEESSYLVCYPAEVYADASHVNLPSTQGDAAGLNRAKAFPLVASTSDKKDLKNLTMKQVCGFIRIKFKGEGKLSHVRFQTNGNEQVSGNFGIAFDADGTPSLTPLASVPDSCKSVKVECTPALSGTDTSYCVIAVPAQTYSSGLKLLLVSEESRCFLSNSTSSKTISRAEVTNISNVFDASKANYAELASADGWNSFAADFNAGKYTDDAEIHITSDISFTGDSDNMTPLTKTFKGTIDGGGHSFKKVRLTDKAIVNKLTGTIKNLKIDSESKLTVSGTANATYYTSLAADLQGTLDNCESAADIDFVASPTENSYFIGGLAGRIRSGSIKNCKVSGTLKDVEVTTPEQYSYVGGIVGDVNKYGDEGNKGSVSGCEFSGKILMGPDAGTSNTGATGITCNNSTGFRIGGITGRCQYGTVRSCSTTSEAVIDVRGDILVAYIGGIVGNAQDSVANCANSSVISVWSANTDASGGKACVGGIAGTNDNVILSCDNSGSINMYAQHRDSFYGGITGYNEGEVTKSINNGNLTEDKYRPRRLHIGGVIGKNANTATDIHNTASVTVKNVPNNNTMGVTYCGGIFGSNEADVDGTDIDNSGAVSVNIAKTTYFQIAAGGIVGLNKASLSGAKNTGTVKATCSSAVSTSTDSPFFTALGGVVGAQLSGAAAATVSGCKNISSNATSEFIYGYITSTTESTCMNWCEGGIIGYVYDAALTVSGCENNAYVRHRANTAKTNKRTSFTGGIVGRITASTNSVTISSCTNKGRCQSQNYNNETTLALGPFLGGIAGSAEGVSGNAVTIENCATVDEDGASPDDVYLYLYRGSVGGVAGYASYANISGCNVSKKISGNGNAVYFGGIAGQAYNSSISGGTMSSEMNAGKNVGGIVSLLGAGSSVSGSKYAGTITNASVKYGAVAATSESGSSITNAKIASTATVNGSAASTANNYVCSDTNASIYGTTIE